MAEPDTTPRDTRLRRLGRALKNSLAIIGGFTVALFLLVALTTFLSARAGQVPGRVILELDLTKGIIEHRPDDVFGSLLSREELTLRDAVEALKRAESDDRVRALIARVDGGLELAHAEELRAAVTSFRSTGKPTVIFSETFGESSPGRGSYYLATAFDEIHLQPSGDVGLAGIIAETPFFGGTLDWLGLEPQMDQRYEYKNALNTIVDEAMGEAQREATTRVLTSFYENLIAGIAEGRSMDPTRVRTLIDEGPYLGPEALAAGLVDELSYRDEVYDSLEARLDGEFLYAREYLRRAGRPHRTGPVIALIYGTGMIQRGESQGGPVGAAVMGSESVSRAFRDAVEDDDVEAILFRVDSPGGSYVASDVIWRETQRARAEGKPVVVSMGGTAASGGYFVSMAADRIVAHPSTVTGSIGVYGGKMLVDDLTEKAGVAWDDVRVGGNATMWSMVEPYSEEEWAHVQSSLDRIYEDFTAKVARGRGLSPDSARSLARGRIWTGADARRLGLVDELGGFEAALAAVKEEAGIDPDREVELRVYPRPRSIVEMLLDPRRETGYSTELAPLARTFELLEPVIVRAAWLAGAREGGALLMPYFRPIE